MKVLFQYQRYPCPPPARITETKYDPDIIGIQESKVQDDFPVDMVAGTGLQGTHVRTEDPLWGGTALKLEPLSVQRGCPQMAVPSGV